MSILSSILDVVTGARESVRIERNVKILAPGETEAREVICYRCEKELGPNHDEERCARKGMSRRFFFGLVGASSLALAARTEGIPIPGIRVQVRAYAGDMFEVETLNPFTLAWDSAKTRGGNPFKSDDGLIQEGGLLEFHGQDLARPDQWLRVHRGLAEMNVLGVVDKTTGQPVKYRIVRSEEAETRVGLAQKAVMQEHYAAAKVALDAKRVIENQWAAELDRRREENRAEAQKRLDATRARTNFVHRFPEQWRNHPSIQRAARNRSLPTTKGILPA